MSPLLAQSGHSRTEDQCPLLGVKRTLSGQPEMSAFDISSLRLDSRRFDERPPFVDLGFVKNAKSLRRLLFARGNFRSEIGDLSSDGRISKRVSDSGIKLGNDRLWRALGGPEPISKCHIEPWHTQFVGRGNLGRRRPAALAEDRIGLELTAAHIRQ